MYRGSYSSAAGNLFSLGNVFGEVQTRVYKAGELSIEEKNLRMIERAKRALEQRTPIQGAKSTRSWVLCADPDPNILKMTAEVLLCPGQVWEYPTEKWSCAGGKLGEPERQ